MQLTYSPGLLSLKEVQACFKVLNHCELEVTGVASIGPLFAFFGIVSHVSVVHLFKVFSLKSSTLKFTNTQERKRTCSLSKSIISNTEG